MPDEQATDCPCHRKKQNQKVQTASCLDQLFQKHPKEASWIGYERYEQNDPDRPDNCSQKDFEIVF
jgi:hypothetical protein